MKNVEQVARFVDQQSYGLDVTQETDLYRRATSYIKGVCARRKLLADDANLFVVVQPDLDFVSDINGHDFGVNGACQRVRDNSTDEVAFVIYLSEDRYSDMGWDSYALTIRHELAHVEADLRYGRQISDGDDEFEIICNWLDAPVTAADHEVMLNE